MRTDNTIKPDDNAWHVEDYPPHILAWLYDWMQINGGLGSLVDIIDLDHRYPGLLKALDTFAWQVALIKQQVDTES